MPDTPTTTSDEGLKTLAAFMKLKDKPFIFSSVTGFIVKIDPFLQHTEDVESTGLIKTALDKAFPKWRFAAHVEFSN
jgi:hypothetical protein